MTRKALPALLLVLGATILLAYLLRGVVGTSIILPVARFAWLVKGYYGAFPQVVYWVFALVAAGLLVAIMFRVPDRSRKTRPERVRLVPGPVQELAFWIQRGEKGFYSKWYLAHLLAEMALSILDQRGVHEKHILRIKALNWSAPEAVGKYLEAGLNTNYTDYPRARRFRPNPPTPFDQDIEPVIRFLESLLESENDDNP